MEAKTMNYRTDNPELKQRIGLIGEKVKLGIQLDRDEKMDLALSIQARAQHQEEILNQVKYYRKLVTGLEKMAEETVLFLDMLYSIAEREKQNRESL
jgi:hypothetical protein